MVSHLSLDYTPIQYLINRTGVVVGSTNIKKRALYQKRVEAITQARNWLLNQSRGLEWDYLLWLDSDVYVPPDALTRMLEYTPQERVISAYARYRQGTSVSHYTSKGYAEWVGFNCVLIGRDVHRRVGDFIADHKGEDVNYCQRITQAGYRIFVAKNVKADHRFREYEVAETPTVAPNQSSIVISNIPAHKGIYAVIFGKTTLTVCNGQAHLNDPTAQRLIEKNLLPHVRVNNITYTQWAAGNSLRITSKPLPHQCFSILLGK